PKGEIQKLKNINANQLLILNQSEAKLPGMNTPSVEAKLFTEIKPIDFTHKENTFVDFKTQVLLPRAYSTIGPATATADVNGDGLNDIFLGGASDKPGELFIQKRDGSVRNLSQRDIEKDSISEVVDAIFFDM